MQEGLHGRFRRHLDASTGAQRAVVLIVCVGATTFFLGHSWCLLQLFSQPKFPSPSPTQPPTTTVLLKGILILGRNLTRRRGWGGLHIYFKKSHGVWFHHEVGLHTALLWSGWGWAECTAHDVCTYVSFLLLAIVMVLSVPVALPSCHEATLYLVSRMLGWHCLCFAKKWLLCVLFSSYTVITCISRYVSFRRIMIDGHIHYVLATPAQAHEVCDGSFAKAARELAGWVCVTIRNSNVTFLAYRNTTHALLGLFVLKIWFSAKWLRLCISPGSSFLKDKAMLWPRSGHVQVVDFFLADVHSQLLHTVCMYGVWILTLHTGL